MKNILFLPFLLLMFALSTAPVRVTAQDKAQAKSDSVTIVQADSTEYEITIFDPGFESWLPGHAKPRWYYSNEYYRTKNIFLVSKWNNRVRQTMHSEPYEYAIDYLSTIDYGLEVNWQLYWYFRYIENKYGIDLGISATD
jgi:hypothetical protein